MWHMKLLQYLNKIKTDENEDQLKAKSARKRKAAGKPPTKTRLIRAPKGADENWVSPLLKLSLKQIHELYMKGKYDRTQYKMAACLWTINYLKHSGKLG